MLNFKKIFNLKVISIFVGITFFLNSVAYGIDLSQRFQLRTHLLTNSEDGDRVLKDAMKTIEKQKALKNFIKKVVCIASLTSVIDFVTKWVVSHYVPLTPPELYNSLFDKHRFAIVYIFHTISPIRIFLYICVTALMIAYPLLLSFAKSEKSQNLLYSKRLEAACGLGIGGSFANIVISYITYGLLGAVDFLLVGGFIFNLADVALFVAAVLFHSICITNLLSNIAAKREESNYHPNHPNGSIHSTIVIGSTPKVMSDL